MSNIPYYDVVHKLDDMSEHEVYLCRSKRAWNPYILHLYEDGSYETIRINEEEYEEAKDTGHC